MRRSVSVLGSRLLSQRPCSSYRHIPKEVYRSPWAKESGGGQGKASGSVRRLRGEELAHLQRQSLLGFTDQDAVRHLEKAVSLAEELWSVETEGVEPMVWPPTHEALACPARPDRPPREGELLSQAEALGNAATTAEEYFVTPPPNVTLDDEPTTKSTE